MASTEWTTITHSSKGKRKHIKTNLPSGPLPSSNQSPAGYRPHNPSDPDLTLSKLTANFSAQLKKWQNSSSRRTLLRHLDNVRETGVWNLTKAFCVASGSFSRLNQTNNRRALLQFAAFVDIATYLEGKQVRAIVASAAATSTSFVEFERVSGTSNPTGEAVAGGIKRFAQDPAYTDLDKRFLSHLGVQHVPIPQHPSPSLPDLDPSSFVFEPFIERLPAILRNLYSACPALYIGSAFPERRADLGACTIREFFTTAATTAATVREGEVVQGEERERNEAAIGFVEGRRPGRYFPRFEEDEGVFEGLMVYWVPEEGDEGEEGN